MGTIKNEWKRNPPKESFEKFTGHIFLKHLKNEEGNLEDYKTDQKDRNYTFWQRDPLAIKIISRDMAVQKLDYMHYNPLQELFIKNWFEQIGTREWVYSTFSFTLFLCPISG